MKDTMTKVLLIEDDSADALLLRGYLSESQHCFFRVTWVKRLSEAVEYIQQNESDVVLLDLSLPDVNGLETFIRFHAVAPTLPIIVLSGLKDDTVVLQAVQSGAQDYLIKGEVDGNGLQRSMRYAIERKTTEKALRESESLYRTLVEISPDSIMMLDLEGRLIVGNQQTASLFGVSKVEELVGEDINHFVAAEDHQRVQNDKSKALEQGSVKGSEYVFLNRKGERFLGEISLQTIFKDGLTPQGFIGVCRDVTERKKLENTLHSTQKLASLGTLAAGIAHEINSPLQVITGMSESLINRIGKGEIDFEKITQSLETINRNGWRVAEIIRSLLSYARVSTECIDNHNLNDIIHDTLLLIEHQLKSWSNITIKLDLAPDLKPVPCDKNKLTQVLINLLTNARDAMPQGGEVKISTAYDELSQQFIIKIRDDGVGIPEHLQQNIFDPFFTTKPLGTGTGLGLSVVLGVIQSHGGKIEVQSKVGEGTEFRIYLPSQRPLSLDQKRSQIAQDQLILKQQGRYDL